MTAPPEVRGDSGPADGDETRGGPEKSTFPTHRQSVEFLLSG